MTTRSPRQRFALDVASNVGLLTMLVLVYVVVLSPASAAPPGLLAGFQARSYAPGQIAALKIESDTTRRVTLRFFLAGAARARDAGADKPTFGKPVGKP